MLGGHLFTRICRPIIPSIPTWDTRWEEHCSARKARLLLYGIKSCLFDFVRLQDKSGPQLSVYQETTCLPFVKGLDCLWEISVWSCSILYTVEKGEAQESEERQRRKSGALGIRSPGDSWKQWKLTKLGLAGSTVSTVWVNLRKLQFLYFIY